MHLCAEGTVQYGNVYASYNKFMIRIFCVAALISKVSDVQQRPSPGETVLKKSSTAALNSVNTHQKCTPTGNKIKAL